MKPSTARALALTAATLLTAAAARADIAVTQPPVAALAASTPATGAFHPAHVIVRTRPGTPAETVAALDARVGATKVLYTSALVPGLRCVQVAEGSVGSAIKAYLSDPAVLYANPDYVVTTLSQSTPYGVNNVNAPAAWANGRGGGAVVADLDTGMDLSHPDLPVPIGTVSFVTGQEVQDGHGHGTHTAGTIVAVDNTVGVVGVAPQASLLVGKVLSNGGSGYDSWVAAGIDWAVANNARVINMSLGSTGFDQGLSDSCDAALAAGTLVVAAAGNANSSTPSYPAAFPSVLSVAAVDSANNRASFSNFGPTVSLSAPGVGVLSTFPTGSAVWQGVTHDAAPISGSGPGSVSGNAVYCGLGNPGDFPPTVAGQIAHIRRGTLTFIDKVNNALAAGAVGVIVSNNVPGLFSGTLNTTVSIPVVGISQSDGDALQAIDGTPATISPSGGHGYTQLNGTSMATPHVTGVAALLFGRFPTATPAQVREAMESTATDLGTPGRDDYYGYGLVNAGAAAARLACVLAAPPVITLPPTAQSACGDAGATFQVTATGPSTLAYRWQIQDTSGAAPTWVDLADGPIVLGGVTIGTSSDAATRTWHTVLVASAGGVNKVRCVVSNQDGCGTAASGPAELFNAPADMGVQGGVAGRDGLYDNNDFIVFIDRFFAQNPVADLGRQGGVLGADGQFDNNDFVVFIDRFFSGC